MGKNIKFLLMYILLFVLGSVVAFVIYWLGNRYFNAGLSKTTMIVNIVADGAILCVVTFLYHSFGKNKHND